MYYGTFLFGRTSPRLGATEYLQSCKLSSIRVSQFFSRESPASFDGKVNLLLWLGRACVIVALTGLIPLSPIGTEPFGNLHKRNEIPLRIVEDRKFLVLNV